MARLTVREHRVFVDGALEVGVEIELDQQAARHLVRVLRLRTGDRVTLFDGRDTEAAAEIVAAHRRHGCRVRIIAITNACRESPLRVELLQGMARGEKMDLVVRKATELGVASIRPVIMQRSEVRPDQGGERRLARWREIIVNACQQCGRTRLPELHAPVTLDRVDPDSPLRIALAPGAATRLRDLAPVPETGIALAVGPEGGFDANDGKVLERLGFRFVGFGPRTLRTETAGIAALAALQSLHGDC